MDLTCLVREYEYETQESFHTVDIEKVTGILSDLSVYITNKM